MTSFEYSTASPTYDETNDDTRVATSALTVLAVGIEPILFGHSAAAGDFPQVVTSKVDDELVADGNLLATKYGMEVEICYVDHGATAESVFRARLAQQHYDYVVVGGGIRLAPAQTGLLEVIVNAIRDLAPDATIVFNTSPDSTAAAVERWYPKRRPLGRLP